MVKPGYKQTEIGVIPEDWEESVFGRIVSIFRGSSPRPIQDYLTNSNDGVNWIKIGDIPVNGKYVTKTEEKIRPEGVSRSREVHSGDFILSNSMSFGRPYILKIDGCIHDGWLTIQNYASQFTTEYLYYLLSSNKIYTQYMAMAAGSSVKNLNKEKVGSLIVIYPKTPEQRRIAKALSDMDELIFSLEKLIAKKKAIKKGAMEELLTGKRRLPGFTGEWMEFSIDDIAELSTVTVPIDQIDIQYYIGTDNMLSNMGGVCNNEIAIPYTVVRGYQAGDVLLSNIRPYLKKIWLADKNGGCSNDVFVIRTKDKKICIPSFLYYSLCQDSFFDEVMANAVGTKMPRGDKAVILEYHIQVPKETEEQTAIVDALRDIDLSIEILECRLGKARYIKQGMMQQLLTGRIRLV